jgi:hypothetical protein
MTSSDDNAGQRLQAPHTARNAEPIFAVLSDHLPATGTVLEVASGSGEHGALYAPRLPHLHWQPSDKDPNALASIDAWRRHAEVENLLPPIEIDLLQFAADTVPAVANVAAMVNVNMIHISPWAACENLMALAEILLPEGAPLCLYGPYKRDGQHTADSNVEFDSWLKSQDTSWGVRDLEAVTSAAATRNLDLRNIVEMPANNLTVIFERR